MWNISQVTRCGKNKNWLDNMSVTDPDRAMVANSDCFGGSALHRSIEAFHTMTSFIGL